jgi:hypothetical protein
MALHAASNSSFSSPYLSLPISLSEIFAFAVFTSPLNRSIITNSVKTTDGGKDDSIRIYVWSPN